MKKILLILSLLISSYSSATGYAVFQRANGDRYFVNTCLSKITDHRAKELLLEVKYGNGRERLKELIEDLNMDVSEEEVFEIVAEVERANELCYAGEIQGYEVLKHIVKSLLLL